MLKQFLASFILIVKQISGLIGWYHHAGCVRSNGRKWYFPRNQSLLRFTNHAREKAVTMQKPKVILFDLDGTLLRVQMSEFISRYVKGLASCCKAHVRPAKFESAMLEAIRTLIICEGNGSATNKQRFELHLCQALSISQMVVQECFSRFRQELLADLECLVKPIPLAKKIIEECSSFGVPLVLATNPVFPAFMIRARLEWAELDHLDFVHMTSFENSCFCKPQAGYFQEVAATLKVSPEECLMIGNDTNHDLSAGAVGMETFLVDTWVVVREEDSWPCPNRGDHAALQGFIRNRFC